MSGKVAPKNVTGYAKVDPANTVKVDNVRQGGKIINAGPGNSDTVAIKSPIRAYDISYKPISGSYNFKPKGADATEKGVTVKGAEKFKFNGVPFTDEQLQNIATWDPAESQQYEQRKERVLQNLREKARQYLGTE